MTTSGSPMQALVRFTFTAEDEGELSVQQGDVVVVVPQSEQPEGWIFVHRSDGQAGFVPVNYLQFQPNNVNKAAMNAPITNNVSANNVGNSNIVNNVSANPNSSAINSGSVNNSNNSNNNNSSLQNTIAQLRGLTLNGNNNNNSTNFGNNNNMYNSNPIGNSGNNKNNLNQTNNMNNSANGMGNTLNNANGLSINTSNPSYSSPGAPISAVSPSIVKNTNTNSSTAVSNPRALLQESSRMLKASKQIKNALTAMKTPLSTSVSNSNSSINISNSSNNSANNAAGLFSIVTLLEKGNFDELVSRHDDCFNRLSQIQLDSFQNLIDITDGASKKIGEATKESQDLADALVRLEERIDEERRKLKQQNEYEKNADILVRSKVNENVDANISNSISTTNASKSGSVGSSTNNTNSVNANSISSSNLLSTGKWQLNTNA